MSKTMTDSPDQQFAEQIRDRLVKQLSSVNEQLEQFAYVASHDLREPLRTIVCFTDLLLKEYGGQLDDQAHDYMKISRQAAKKMEAMVADLLDYGRLGQVSVRINDISCDTVLLQAKEALSESIKSTKAVIESKPLPTLKANPIRLSRLFQNLIGNALKYQKNGTTPVIRIAASDKGTHWLFSVADNGIGIENDYLDIIFAPFKRLHSDHEFQGTGLGLAICKQIVESCGGSIWAESTHDEGSVFFFTLPKNGHDSTTGSLRAGKRDDF